jgi:isoamylase
MKKPTVWPGRPYPLGAEGDEGGVNFALYAENATAVDLCLFDDSGQETRVRMPEQANRVWHAYWPGIKPGQLYGYRVSGPYQPEQGHRFNPAKLLLDPYAKAISGLVEWPHGAAVFGYKLDDPRADLSIDRTDSAPYVPKSVVVDDRYDWEGDTPPRVPWTDTVIYETHVKGMTARHAAVPPGLRGRYAGLACQPVLDHLRALGVTAVELLPVHAFVNDRSLLEKGLTNYWGYNSIGYFAPEARYSSLGTRGEQVAEFKDTVKALHRAGLEVILDVVYNHTGEGNQLGPTLCFRGIDNAAYYRLLEKDRRYTMDYTGTGNTLNTRRPNVLQLIMDSLRYWVLEMHVDGFRFDLATTLARDTGPFDPWSGLLKAVRQDPALNQVKLIAEPWDVGEGGYQVGSFPPGWSEWNGRYRDTVRDFWRGEDGTLGDLASRFTGSSDLYHHEGRQPTASINFVTAHDGFTLNDLVSYNDKHNAANGENNQDGDSNNRSWNCGIEGSSDDPAVLSLRAQQKRNLLATLLLSQGVPMLLGGDELGRSQNGNNNAYCQDNELSWFDWDHSDQDLLAFTRQIIAFRKAHPVFRQRTWFRGRPIRGLGVSDISWFSPGGEEMSAAEWRNGAHSMAVFLYGRGIRAPDAQGQRLTDDSFYLCLNGDRETLTFALPTSDWFVRWSRVIDTSQPQPMEDGQEIEAGDEVLIPARSVVVFRHVA